MSSGDVGVDPRMMTLRQAAKRSGLSSTTLRRYIRSGRLRARLVPGRYGPEYVIAEEDFQTAGLFERQPTSAPQSQTANDESPEPEREAETERQLTAPRRKRERQTQLHDPLVAEDVVSGLLYRELLMKHEHLLVQYGMLRASGRQLYEMRKQLEQKAREAQRAVSALRRTRDKHAREIGQLRAQLRQAELEIAEQLEKNRNLATRLRTLQASQRTGQTARAIDRNFDKFIVGGSASEPPAPGAKPRDVDEH